MAGKAAVAARQTSITASPEVIREEFLKMILVVPEMEGDGGANIIAQVLAGGSVMDSNDIWQTGDSDKLIGVELEIRAINRFASDFDEGNGWFFLVEAINRKTGELVRFSNGSQTVMAQLVKAHLGGELPIIAVIEQAKVRKGHTGKPPQHLRVLAVKVGA